MSSIELDRIKKIKEAQLILSALQLPKKQTNSRSALVLLSLSNVKPQESWSDCESPLLQTYVMMDFMREHYEVDYKPNSRETIRRQTLHQFEQAGLITRNRDNPARATNSKDNNYSLNEEIIDILRAFPDKKWQKGIESFLKVQPSLKKEYEKERNLHKIPVKLPGGKEVSLSPGKHNQLHADIVHQFCPRFIGKDGIVLYIGDTASSRSGEGGKLMHLEMKYLESLGIPPMSHEKLPDVVVYDPRKNWLFLIEAVTSHGPVSPKRWKELEEALIDSNVEKVYVTAFPDMNEFKKNIADIAWETEVWISEIPDHMVHFNGDKFLGPSS
jgi:hypothetical protein